MICFAFVAGKLLREPIQRQDLLSMEAILSAALCWLIGIVGLWTGCKQLKNRTALNHWPTTQGRVVERGTYQPNIPTTGPPAFRHAPLVKYAYQVGGKEFTNDRIRPQRIQQPEHNTKEWAQKTADSFSDEVTVHYNPDDPGEAFLVQTSQTMLYIVVLASGLIILIGLLVILVKLTNGR
jgi:hypothetical protein